MFVVTGLHTKRRQPIGVDSSSATIEKHSVERLPAVSHQHRHLHKHLCLSSNKVAPRVSEPRMTRNDSNRDAWNRREIGKRPSIKGPPGRPASTRVRKFIPKPLILVERMRARQILLESSPPVASESRVAPDSVNRPTIAMTAPPSTHVTPTTHRIPTCSILSNDSHSSSSVSFRVSSQNDVVFGSGSGMIPRSVRPLSVVTLADSSSSTDTFVADSPCCIKQASSKVPVLAVTSVHLNVESDVDKKSVSDTGVPVFVDSILAGFVHRTCQSTDTFEPFATSTPFTTSQGNTGSVPSPTAFITSTVYSTCPLEQTPGFSDSVGIVSLTSREVYPFNAPKGAYIVKLPDSGSTVSLSNRTSVASLPSTAMSYSRLIKSGAPLATLANAPKPVLDFKRLSTRVGSPSPTLVLDGVFALPCTSSPSFSPSPRRRLNGFPRPRKPTSRRPLSDISNTLAIAPASQPLSTSPTSSCVQAGPESPRSKLAHVLTAHVQPHTMTRTRVPPLVKGVEVSNDPRTQREIEGLRVRRAVGRDRSDGGGDVDGENDGRGMVERMSLASVGMVAKLRARWETGAVAHGGGVEGRA
ncbi:hypothetical protein J3R82DRAFT_8395 [Butyriboletus roseoflavus]|nr:hypothetical protein J3R82DRAFT_8395 [Butyriboletus roseoflavus]